MTTDTTSMAQEGLTLPYCTFCGNEQTVETPETGIWLGALCEPFLKGPLLLARDAWDCVRQEWGRCCGGLSSDIGFGRTLAERIQKFTPATHLSLHPHEHGTSSYYSPVGLCVDCGHQHTGVDDMCIAPYDPGDGQPDAHICPCNAYVPPAGTEPTISVDCGAWFYADHAQPYFVFDNDVESTGVEIGEPVPYSMGRDEFLAALGNELDIAARNAWLADYAQCGVCGNHYYFPNGPCCEEEDEDES